MNWKFTLLMLSAVLLIMLGAGGASAYIGYLMGREALKVVTQPDTETETKIDRKKPFGGAHKGLKIIDEQTVLIEIYNRKHQSENPSSSKPASKVASDNSQSKPVDSIQPDKFPFQDRSQGVTMEVTQARLQGNSLMLSVNLRNEGTSAARFLYSFLDVRDANNRPLSAIADGLPVELPADGQEFSGQFIIPTTLLDNSPTISLSLQDYPDQKIDLNLNSIPVTQ